MPIEIERHELVKENGEIVGIDHPEMYRVLAGFVHKRNGEQVDIWCAKCAYEGHVPDPEEIQGHINPVDLKDKFQDFDGEVVETGPSLVYRDETCSECGEAVVKNREEEGL